MKLTGRVTKLESGKSYTDGLERVTIKINESTAPMYSDFTVPNVDALKLDDELEMSLIVVPKAKVARG
jgi:hypothetical protein